MSSTGMRRRAGAWLWPAILLATATVAAAEEPVRYRLDYPQAGGAQVEVRIELPGIFEQASGVDTREIFERWMRPPG
jgi:hypothetical protein